MSRLVPGALGLVFVLLEEAHDEDAEEHRVDALHAVQKNVVPSVQEKKRRQYKKTTCNVSTTFPVLLVQKHSPESQRAHAFVPGKHTPVPEQVSNVPILPTDRDCRSIGSLVPGE